VQFIPIAEEYGLIQQLGDWVLTRACSVVGRFAALTLAVNLSPIQLRDPDLSDRIFDIMRRTGFDATRLELEITESANFTAGEVAKESLRRLREAGVKIALDDFGTGYSSLTHLDELEIDRIKIDRSFIMHIERPQSAAIVEGITHIAYALQLRTTAEGVETEGQRRCLALTRCTELQGYLFSKPMPEEALAEFVKEYVCG
jgi:EAL domain-containing protein (putative c-di-GMP-specific phosphodiesterase class I)